MQIHRWASLVVVPLLFSCVGGDDATDDGDEDDGVSVEDSGAPDEPDLTVLALTDPTSCNTTATTNCSYVATLLSRVTGYAKVGGTSGGTGGAVCNVTNLYDDGRAGSLRACASAPNRWIRFRVGGTVHLQSDLALKSNTTIDARGYAVTLSDHGVLAWTGSSANETQNIILENLKLANVSSTTVGGILGIWNASRILVDHCEFQRPPTQDDKLILVWRRSDFITISWCWFHNSWFAVYIGGTSEINNPGPDDTYPDHSTLDHNFFDGANQRNPLVRWKRVHLKNNLIAGWGQYGVGSISRAHVRVEKNIFKSGGSSLAVHAVNWGGGNSNGLVKKILNQQNGFTIEVNNPDNVFVPPYINRELAVDANATLERRIRCGAGAKWGAYCP